MSGPETTGSAVPGAARPGARLRAHAVHAYTASGIVAILLAAMELTSTAPDPRRVFVWLAVAVAIDATDGALARRWRVSAFAPRIDGRKIDDIVDYLGFTFVPLLLVCRMGWLPGGVDAGWPWLLPPLIASLFGFASLDAKDDEGFFRGFPSYWNAYAWYVGAWFPALGPWPGAIGLLLLSVLTVLPIRMLYPTRPATRWFWPILIGGTLWGAVLVAALPLYPPRGQGIPPWLLWGSLAYPALYVFASVQADRAARRRRG